MPSRTPRVLVLSLLAALLAIASLTAPARATDPDPVAPAVDDATAAAKETLAEVQDLFEGLETLGVGAEPTSRWRCATWRCSRTTCPTRCSRPPSACSPAPPTAAVTSSATATGSPRRPGVLRVVCVHYVTDRRPRGRCGRQRQRRTRLRRPRAEDDDRRARRLRGRRLPPTEVRHRRRQPRPNEKPDVYLADIGNDGLYGYCATDDDIPVNGPQDTWGYCVLDNDYSKGEFPTNTPKENLQVTAAHEYFHAVQFGYDISEDGWVMEATATWAEDELYDGVNDNVQYLRSGPMSLPHKSLDQFFQSYHYGAWIFFRYLTERFPVLRRRDADPGPRPVAPARRRVRRQGRVLARGREGGAPEARPVADRGVRRLRGRQPDARPVVRRGQGQPLPARATGPGGDAVAGGPPDRPAAAHARPPGRRDGPLHPREEPGQREVAARADARHGRTLEGHRRGGHDPAAPAARPRPSGSPSARTATPRRSTSSRPRG